MQQYCSSSQNQAQAQSQDEACTKAYEAEGFRLLRCTVLTVGMRCKYSLETHVLTAVTSMALNTTSYTSLPDSD